MRAHDIFLELSHVGKGSQARLSYQYKVHYKSAECIHKVNTSGLYLTANTKTLPMNARKYCGRFGRNGHMY